MVAMPMEFYYNYSTLNTTHLKTFLHHTGSSVLLAISLSLIHTV